LDNGSIKTKQFFLKMESKDYYNMIISNFDTQDKKTNLLE